MELKYLTTKDLEKLLTLEETSFSKPWSRETLEELLSSDRAAVLGLFEGEELLGYSCLEWVLDEGSLTDIAVLKNYRGQGISKLLMDELTREAKERNLQFVTLEVRESNLPAIGLYKKYGFEDVGKRPRYYSDPTEDAVLMTKYMTK